MIKGNFRTHKSNASRIRRTYKTYFAFNFSFLTRDKRYNLDKNNNSIDKNVQAKLLEKIEKLSIEEISVVLGWAKEQGLEQLPDNVVSLSINPFFSSSGRLEEYGDVYWVFRLNDKGRVIGKINRNIFYILAIDTKFNLYKH